MADGTSLSMQLDYLEDATPRGPAGCASDAAMNHTAETFIVVDGTVIPDFDLSLLLGRASRQRRRAHGRRARLDGRS